MADDDFGSLFEFLPIGAYRSSPDGRMIRSNPALVRLNGCDSESELHALVHDIATEWYVDPQRRTAFKTLLERDGRVLAFVSEIHRQKTRERIWIRENAHVLRDPDGRVRCYEGTVEEITRDVHVQQALEASRQDMARMVDLLPGVVYKTRWAPDGRSRQVVFVSSKVMDLFGVSPQDLIGQPDLVSRLRHPDDDEHAARRVREAVAADAPLEIEFRVQRPDGRPCWVRMFSMPAPAEAGCKVRVGVLFDITASHLAEQALRAQGDLWKQAMESTGDAVWDWDLEQDVEVLSGEVAALYGYLPGELPPLPAALDALTHPADLAAMRQARNEHFAQRTRAYVNEHRIRCKDGRWKWVLSRGVVIRRAADGRPLRMIGTHTDIDAAKRGAELQRERDLAAAADRAKSDFLSRVSHELRTPLNGVLGFAQLLCAEESRLTPGHAEWARHILSSGRHLLALVDDVLDLSALQSGQLRLQLEPVDLAAVVQEVLTMSAADAQAAQVRLPLLPALPGQAAARVRGDRTRCLQIVANLVSNAIKYNRRGGHVQITLQAADGLARLAVCDDGPGIAREQQARLFEPFERLAAARSTTKGTGLGLAVSRQLAQAMGGTIELDSDSGRGACFTLQLPLAEPGVDLGPVA
jgi:PAS domain S-box-containing protein